MGNTGRRYEEWDFTDLSPENKKCNGRPLLAFTGETKCVIASENRRAVKSDKYLYWATSIEQ